MSSPCPCHLWCKTHQPYILRVPRGPSGRGAMLFWGGLQNTWVPGGPSYLTSHVRSHSGCDEEASSSHGYPGHPFTVSGSRGFRKPQIATEVHCSCSERSAGREELTSISHQHRHTDFSHFLKKSTYLEPWIRNRTKKLAFLTALDRNRGCSSDTDEKTDYIPVRKRHECDHILPINMNTDSYFGKMPQKPCMSASLCKFHASVPVDTATRGKCF